MPSYQDKKLKPMMSVSNLFVNRLMAIMNDCDLQAIWGISSTLLFDILCLCYAGVGFLQNRSHWFIINQVLDLHLLI